MGSNYLAGVTDGFGLPSPLPNGLAAQASALVDVYLKRPKGLVYELDANGNPCAMVAAQPDLTLTLQTSIAPGSNVAATVTQQFVRPDMVGDVLVLDAANPAAREAVTVTAATAPNQLTFTNVQFAHNSGASAQRGLVLAEDRNAPSKRSIVRVSEGPIVNVLSLLGRYAYGRRSDQVGGLYQEMNLLAAVQTFGGPPQWIPIPTQQCSWSNATSELWVPAGMLMAYYSDVRIKYIAGFLAGQLPDPIIRATVNIAGGILQSSQFGGAINLIAAGDTRIQRFMASVIDDDTRTLLDPYKAKTVF
jgi:hypothetical protein